MAAGKIRIGVVGLGFGERVHVPAFRADARCEVAAICASTQDRADEAAKRLGIARGFGDWTRMVADPDLDAISFAVPPALQPRMVEAAAAARKHVFCEKPAAMSTAAAESMLAAVREANVVHGIDFIFAAVPAWREAKAILERGELGPIRHATITWQVETPSYRLALDSWKTRAREGGGALSNFAPHSLHYVEWMLGPVEKVMARLSPHGQEDTRLDAWFVLKGGATVSMVVAVDAFLGSGHRMEVHGARGTLVLENAGADYARGFSLRAGVRPSTDTIARVALDGAPPRTPIPGLEERMAPISGGTGDGRAEVAGWLASRFLDSISLSGADRARAPRPAFPTLAEGARVQRLIAAIRAADERGAWMMTP